MDMIDKVLNDLPEFLEQPEVESYIESLVSVKCDDPLKLLDAMYEVSLKHADNYVQLKPEIYNLVSGWIFTIWNKESVESTESCLSIIVNLGLQETYNKILSCTESIQSDDVKQEIQDTINDVGLSIIIK